MNLRVKSLIYIIAFLFCPSYADKQSAASGSKCGSGQECVPFTECSQVFKNKHKNETVQICGIERHISYVCCGRNVSEPSSEAAVALSWSDVTPQQKDGAPISQRKCQEYAKLVNAGENGKTEKCAIKNEKIRPGRAVYAEFPHMVSVIYHNYTDNITEHACGGSLISERFVLTAGVCVYYTELIFKLRLKWVEVGSIKLNSSNKQIIPVAQLIPHPDYKSWQHYRLYGSLPMFDIALIKLMWAPILGPELRPACLPRGDEIISGRELILSGWGRSNLTGPPVNNELLKAVLFQVPHETCRVLLENETGKKVKFHDPSIFCAGHPSKRSSFSRADVGGPLQIISSDPFCTYTIVGIPFYAPPPDFTGTPSVYSRVQYFQRWIENIVWA